MSRDEFDSLVARLTAAAERHPGFYTLRVGSLVVFGYAYILGVLAFCLLFLLGIIFMVVSAPHAGTIKLGLFFGVIAGGLAWSICKGLWVPLEAPEGVELSRADASGIFELLDRLRRQFHGPVFHHVLIVPDYNAAVVQVPRFGLFGWQRNYLLLGLPLMQSLSAEEFEAVLAHEFGHLSGNHARFGAWIYRIRRTWERVCEQMFRQQQRGAFVLTRFLKWFWPKFNAYAFVLARANEYEADRCSAEFSGKEAAARALTRVHLDAALLEESFWPALFNRVSQESEPPATAFVELASALKQEPDPAHKRRWLRAAFLRETNNYDTHPALRDRLRALDALPSDLREEALLDLAPVVSESAAAKYLGEFLPQLSSSLNEKWRQQNLEAWRGRREQIMELDQQIARADSEASARSDPDVLWRKARALVDRDGDEAGQPAVAQLLTLAPGHPEGNFIRGRYLLSKEDPCGIPFLERAMAEDESLTEPALQLLYGFYSATGQKEKLRPIEDQLEAFQIRAEEAARERNQISHRDAFAPHQLRPAILESLREIFRGEPDIFRVAAARKELQVFTRHPLLVLALFLKTPWWKLRSSSADQKLVNRLVERMDCGSEFIVVVAKEEFKRVGKKIAAVPDAEIYRRDNSRT